MKVSSVLSIGLGPTPDHENRQNHGFSLFAVLDFYVLIQALVPPLSGGLPEAGALREVPAASAGEGARRPQPGGGAALPGGQEDGGDRGGGGPGGAGHALAAGSSKTSFLGRCCFAGRQNQIMCFAGRLMRMLFGRSLNAGRHFNVASGKTHVYGTAFCLPAS